MVTSQISTQFFLEGNPTPGDSFFIKVVKIIIRRDNMGTENS